METRLVGQSVVLLARSFNPTITNQIWLDQNRIVSKDEYLPGYVFTDVMVQAVTKRFVLLVTPDQLQMSPTSGGELNQELILERIGRFIDCLPHTPFYALGLNFNWHYQPSGKSINDRTRELFLDESNEFQRQFDSDDTRYGGYFSLPFRNGRLKIDIKPVTVSEIGIERSYDAIHFAFNFHFDIGPGLGAVDQIRNAIENWQDCNDHASSILEKSCQTLAS